MSNTQLPFAKDISTLDKVLCINLDVHLWSGRSKLRHDDLKGVQGKLPPADLASLGSKKIVDPDAISGFDNLKKEAERECLKVGVRFLGGYAIPIALAGTLAAKLDDIAVRFEAEKQKLLANYDNIIDQWIKQHNDWRESIASAVLDRNEVEGKISFGWQAYRIVEASACEEPGSEALNRGLSKSAGGLANQLFGEISQMAASLVERSLVGRDKVTQKIRSPIRAMREKLNGLSFLDPHVVPVIAMIDSVLEKLPQQGHIEGSDLSALSGLAYTLSDPDRLKRHIEMMANPEGTSEEASNEGPEVSASSTSPEASDVSAESQKMPTNTVQPNIAGPVAVPDVVVVSPADTRDPTPNLFNQAVSAGVQTGPVVAPVVAKASVAPVVAPDLSFLF